MSKWWVRTETDVYSSHQANWHGAYDDPGKAGLVAKRLSRPHEASELVAEVICGDAGSLGRRIAEYYQGNEYHPGESGWYDKPPSETVAIPDPCSGQQPAGE